MKPQVFLPPVNRDGRSALTHSVLSNHIIRHLNGPIYNIHSRLMHQRWTLFFFSSKQQSSVHGKEDVTSCDVTFTFLRIPSYDKPLIRHACNSPSTADVFHYHFTTGIKGKVVSNSITLQRNIKTRHERSSWQAITQSLTSVRNITGMQLPSSHLTSDPGLSFKPLLLEHISYFNCSTLCAYYYTLFYCQCATEEYNPV